jgi:hypothetical protein
MRMKKRPSQLRWLGAKETSKNLINAGRGIVNKPKKQAESGLGDIIKKIMKNI